MNATQTESAQALEAFTLYRSLGAARSIVAVSHQLGKSKTIIDRWSRTHNWVERCRQHDQAIAAEAAERDKQARLADIDRKRQDRIKVAAAVRGKGVAALAKMEADALAKRPYAVVQMLDYADKTERLDMGEATDRTEVTGKDGADLFGQMSDADILRLAAATLAPTTGGTAG